jgi:GT2 family glycosyltransferase
MSKAAACALVVTFDRKRLLVSCIEALLAQTRAVAEVYVVDNASTDGTQELLRELGFLDRPGFHYLRLEENRGSSGGFAAGVAAARESDADWLWILDDDAEPEPDALERLLESPWAGDQTVAALCGSVVREDGSVDLGHRGRWRRRPRHLTLEAYAPGSTQDLDYFTFVGPMLRMRAARAADPPRADFFIWCDDYEYSFRVKRHGALRLVPESRVLHRSVGQAHSTPRSRLLNRVTGWDLDPMPLTSFWRSICGIRNYIWIKKHYEGQGPVSACGTVAQFLLKAVLYEDHPRKRIPWLLRYARAGRRGEFVNIPPAEWRSMVTRGEV